MQRTNVSCIQRVYRPIRLHFRFKTNFIIIDVPNSGNQFLIEQKRFNSSSPAM